MHGKPKSISKRSDIRVAVAAEAGRTIALARRVGKRLLHQLNQTKGQIPNEEWLEAAKWQTRAIAELGRLVTTDEIGGPNADKTQEELSDEQYADELRHIAVGLLRKASPDERAALIAEADGPAHNTKSAEGWA